MKATMNIKRIRATIKFALIPVAIAAAILVGLGIWSIERYGSLADGIAFVNGSVVVADESVVELGQVPVSTTVEGTFTLKNLTSHPVTILGAQPECQCVVASALPVKIDGLSSTSFALRFTPAEGELGLSQANSEGVAWIV